MEHYCISIIVHFFQQNKNNQDLITKISYVGNQPSLCEPDSEPLVSSLTLGFFWLFPGFCSHASEKAFIRFSSSVFRQLKNPISGWLHLTSTAPFLWFLKSEKYTSSHHHLKYKLTSILWSKYCSVIRILGNLWIPFILKLTSLTSYESQSWVQENSTPSTFIKKFKQAWSYTCTLKQVRYWKTHFQHPWPKIKNIQWKGSLYREFFYQRDFARITSIGLRPNLLSHWQKY